MEEYEQDYYEAADFDDMSDCHDMHGPEDDSDEDEDDAGDFEQEPAEDRYLDQSWEDRYEIEGFGDHGD